jgi:hypothetical protein
MQEESVIKSYALREIFFAVTEQKRDFMQIHTEQVLGLFAGQVGKRIALPHGLLAKREYKGVLLKKEQIVSLSKNDSNPFKVKIRCAVLLIGNHSVIPSTIPKIIVHIKSIIIYFYPS